MTTKSVSLDTDVVQRLEAEARTEERSFSQIVNRKLRSALGIKTASKPKRKKQAA